MGSLTEIKLEIRNLKKNYGSKTVLHEISFDVYTGEFLSILGPSGCGKTTILRILMGLLPSTSGTILKDGRDITSISPDERGMGIVFQNYALFENMTVLRNVEYALRFHKDKKAQASQIAENLLKRVNMWEFRDKKPGRPSGGQQQRIAIARTLALSPDIILFDEPMSALDVDTRLALRREMKDIQKEYGSTMIYITHDQEEAFAMSDRIMVMEEGRIHQIASPEELALHPTDDYVQRFVLDNLQIKADSLSRFIQVQK